MNEPAPSLWTRARYEIRWWRWFLTGPDVAHYGGPGAAFDDAEEKHDQLEPALNGRFPHRVDDRKRRILEACGYDGDEFTAVEIARSAHISLGRDHNLFLQLEREGRLTSRFVGGPYPRKRLYRRVR